MSSGSDKQIQEAALLKICKKGKYWSFEAACYEEKGWTTWPEWRGGAVKR